MNKIFLLFIIIFMSTFWITIFFYIKSKNKFKNFVCKKMR